MTNIEVQNYIGGLVEFTKSKEMKVVVAGKNGQRKYNKIIWEIKLWTRILNWNTKKNR